MLLERLKTVSAVRAAKLTGICRGTIARAMDSYRDSGGRIGLAFVQDEGEGSRRKIRLCAIDDWLTQRENAAKYATSL